MVNEGGRVRASSQSDCDEAQKTLAVREMMPKDIKREFLTGPRKFDEMMEKLAVK